MTHQPLLSVIIPTRERADTLVSTLATALDQRSTDYEVVVSDNASADNTREVVAAARDPRVRYFNTQQRLSMGANYEFALQQALGRHVVFIGDDDAVVPGGIDYLLSILRASADERIYMWPLHIYDWPVAGKPARVAYLAPSFDSREIDLKEKARFVVSAGGWKYYELPSPYHAAVPKAILDAIRKRTGRVFHSTQPDVFTAMAIPAFADRAVNLGRTVTLNGRSARSNGLGFVRRSALTNIDKFLREYGSYSFHSTLSPSVSGPANMVPDAVLVAKDMFPEIYGDVEFNYSAMWAYVSRMRFVSHTTVLLRSREIRKSHPLRLGSFLGMSLIHELAVLRRSILNAVQPRRNLPKRTPDNIRGFVQLLRHEPLQ